FSVVETLLLEHLRVPRPEELFAFVRVGARERGESFSFPAFTFLKANAQTLGEIAGYAPRVGRVRTNDTEADLGVHLVSDDYFRVLRVTSTLGRTLDDVRGADNLTAAVVSDGFRRRFLDPYGNLLGAPVTINGVTYTVVGIVPPGFGGLS